VLPTALPAASISDFVTGTEIEGVDLLIALIVVVAAWVAARLTRRGVVKVLGRVQGVNEDMRALAGRLARYFVLLIGIGVALTFLGAPIQPLLTAAIIVGVVASLALRGVADNFAAGVVLQTRRPIQLGDQIESLGHAGVVHEMNGRSVVIETSDGRLVHLPNGKVLDSPIVNRSGIESLRTEVEIRCATTGDVNGTLAAITRATADVANVLGDPPPLVLLEAIDDDGLAAVVRFWCAPPAAPLVTTNVIVALSDVTGRHGAASVRSTGRPTVGHETKGS
jgi:small-conductance mechanosensitive channel